jgi:hypothetical protein
MALWSKKGSGSSTKLKSAKISPDELVTIAKRYILQETVVPLKRIAKVLGIGLAGAVVFGLGAVIVLVGVLRVLQNETGNVFGGNWSFAPYLLTAVVGIGLAAGVGGAFLSSLRVPVDHTVVE